LEAEFLADDFSTAFEVHRPMHITRVGNMNVIIRSHEIYAPWGACKASFR
jgi:hypothetical protein